MNRIRSSEAGFSMIEALIAFAVLAFGIMGVVTLLATSKSSQFEMVQRARAISAANALVERIRINPAGLPSYVTGWGSPLLDPDDLLAAPVPDCEDTPCTTGAQLAAYDLYRWQQEVIGANSTSELNGNTVNTGGLVDARACVIFTPQGAKTATGQLEVVIDWLGMASTSAPPDLNDRDCAGDAIPDKKLLRRLVLSTYVIDENEL